MLRKFGIIAVLSLLIAAFAAIPAMAAIETTTNFNNAPNGAHFKGSARPDCKVLADGLTVSCNTYKIAGVGNTNAKADLTANYTATVDCRNHGGKIVPVKASVHGAKATTGDIAPQNGVLTVPALSTAGKVPSDEDFEAAATCPNGNWTKEIRGSAVLSSFTYTLTFDGFTNPVIKITGP